MIPGSRRASERSPPCSRERSSLIFRRRSAAAAAQPLPGRCARLGSGSAALLGSSPPPLLNWLTKPRLFRPLPPRRGIGGAWYPAGREVTRRATLCVEPPPVLHKHQNAVSWSKCRCRTRLKLGVCLTLERRPPLRWNGLAYQ